MRLPKIKLYGAENCHKTQYYQRLLRDRNVPFKFLDVVNNDTNALELRSLYLNGKLNFPTILIGEKKLRNPKNEELWKWLDKLKS